MSDKPHIKSTKFPAARAPSVIAEAWYDDTGKRFPAMWIKSKDGDLVCIPHERMQTLVKLIRRGRN